MSLFGNARLFLLLCTVSLSLIFLDRINFLNLPKSAVQTVTIPIQYGVYKSGRLFLSQADFIFVARSLWNENIALKKQLIEVLLENAALQKKVFESSALISQKEAIDSQTYNLLPARIIAIDRFVSLDKGSTDGVSVGAPVIFKETFLGQVVSVSSKTSQVLTPFAPDSKIAVFSQSKEGRARGILVGQFGVEFLMDKILHQEVIAEGDLVYSEGTEGKLPRGLILGKVSKVIDKQNEVFKSARVSPLYKMEDLNLVFIIRN